MTGNISLTDPWIPLGPFTGEFYGGGNTISGLTITSGRNVGLFGQIQGGTVRDLVLSGVEVAGSSSVGGLAGEISGASDINNVQSSGNVEGDTEVGGLVGYLHSGPSISDSSATGTVQGGSTTGGFIGYMTESTISTSYADAAVTGDDAEGYGVGGFVGEAGAANISSSYAESVVDSLGEYVGGFAGNIYDDSEVTASFATGNVEGKNYVGGFAGALSTTRVHDSFASGSVTALDIFGGFLGDAYDSQVQRSYVSGSVRVSDPGTYGGFAAVLRPNDLSTVDDSFWDSEVSSDVVAGGTPAGTNVDTEDMQSFSTYDNAGWSIYDGWQSDVDFESAAKVWGICDGQGYPFLRWYVTQNPCAAVAPGIPGTPTAVAGDGSASVTWSASSGGPASYSVTSSPGGLTCTVNAPAMSCTVTGLTNGISYTFTVTAKNDQGTSSASAASSAVTPASSGGGGDGGGGGTGGGGSDVTPAPTPSPTPTPTSTPTTGPAPDPLAPITGVQNPNIPSGGLNAGGSRLLVNGRPVPVTVEPNKRADASGLVIDAPELNPPLRMTLEGRDAFSNALGLTSQQALILETQPTARLTRAKGAITRQSQPVALATGRGFMPNSPVRFYLLPDTEIGMLMTDAQGNCNGRLPIPSGLRPDVYTLQSNGLAPDNSVRSLSMGVLVKRAPVSVKVAKASEAVYFDNLSASLTQEGKKALRTLVKRTRRQVDSVVSVGFVQGSGSPVNDRILSTQRARSVVAYLKLLGVKGAITVRGDGAAKEFGAEGRRVDVSVTYRAG